MGKTLHRLGLIIGGGITAGAGYGVQLMKSAAQDALGFSDAMPVTIPMLLDGATYLLYGAGGLIAVAGILGLVYGLLKSIVGGSDTQEPPAPQQPRQPQPQQPRQGQPQDQQPGRGQPRQQPRSDEGQPGRQPRKGRQPVDDDRDRR